MLTNLFLAILLILLSIIGLVTLDRTTTYIGKMIKFVLRMTRRSKLLTTYILRAYLRYRKAVSKPLTHNYY